jgi:hypothetical protein
MEKREALQRRLLMLLYADAAPHPQDGEELYGDARTLAQGLKQCVRLEPLLLELEHKLKQSVALFKEGRRKQGWMSLRANFLAHIRKTMGTDDPRRTEWKNAIRDAGKYAVRCATMNGADNDFDPDALVQNLVVGMIGYFTPDGFSSDAWANPEQPTPAILTDTDAAVARERGRWVEAINLMVTNEQVREVIIRGVDRARSAKGE